MSLTACSHPSHFYLKALSCAKPRQAPVFLQGLEHRQVDPCSRALLSLHQPKTKGGKT